MDFVKQKPIYLHLLFTVLYCTQLPVIRKMDICSLVLLFQIKRYFLFFSNCKIGSKIHLK